MRIPNLPVPEPRVIIDERRKLILADVSLRGYFILDEGLIVKNKFNRNMGYIIDGLLRLADVTVYDEGGAARTAKTSTGGLLNSPACSYSIGLSAFLQYGTGATSPTVTDNNLATPDINLPTHYIDTVESSTSTQLVVAARWAPDAGKSYTEAGLKWMSDSYYNYAHLLARTVFPSYLSRSAYTEYFDGYAISFPASYTVWFIRALQMALSGHDQRRTRGRVAVATDGSSFSIMAPRAFAGTPDVMIGSGNTPPSPTDYNLKSPIASLSSQSQSVEVDTTAQEVRVVRTGTYTPTTSVTLSEIGLFANLNAYVAGSATTKKTMLVRVALSTPITLNAGTTYTLGIVIRLP
ncbi:MAG: hypothetical protein QW658_00005 [Candidatus Bathyarchaeia archaeon]